MTFCCRVLHNCNATYEVLILQPFIHQPIDLQGGLHKVPASPSFKTLPCPFTQQSAQLGEGSKTGCSHGAGASGSVAGVRVITVTSGGHPKRPGR